MGGGIFYVSFLSFCSIKIEKIDILCTRRPVYTKAKVFPLIPLHPEEMKHVSKLTFYIFWMEHVHS